MKTLTKNYVASENALDDIMLVSYEGQNPDLRRSATGYENFMNALPVMEDCDVVQMATTKVVMAELSIAVQKDSSLMDLEVSENQFKRTILAIEPPVKTDTGWEEKAELVVAHWGKNFESPIHGHSTGFLYEEVLSGKILVNNYRIVDIDSRTVRPHSTEIINKGVFVNNFTNHNPNNVLKRQTLVHNFKALERSNTLHFLPEHTRDGRDNGFVLEQWNGLKIHETDRITSKQGMYLQPGDVVLVRSSNVPEYGDHFIVVTGHPVKKEHGYRVQETVVMASKNDTDILNSLDMQMGLILLKLNARAKNEFLAFHGIEVNNREVIFPKF